MDPGDTDGAAGHGRRSRRPDVSIVREEVLAAKAYEVPASDGLLKLDAMENPYGLPEALRRELASRLARLELNRYPPANPREFKERLAGAIGLPAGQAVMLGNGSDELIRLVVQACARPGAAVLSPWPSFVMYAMSARFCGCRFVGVPLTAGFEIDLQATLEALATHRPALTFVAWPNNPTGTLFDRAAVEAIVEAAPGAVVLDEAYLPFVQDTFLPELVTHGNLLVLRTMSKLGLAGIRLGYLCGDPAWIAEFEKVRTPYNVSSLTLAAAALMLDHLPVLEEQAARVRAERARVLASLRALPGVATFESAANFVLFRVARPHDVFERLRERGILIRNVSDMHPMLSGCLRATVGRPEENDRFLEALAGALAPGDPPAA